MSENELFTARWHCQQGRIQEAEAIYLRLLEEAPDNCRALEALAEIFFGQKKYQESVALLVRAIPHEPSNHELLFKLAAMLQFMGQVEAAIPYYERVVELRPEYISAQMNLGACYFQLMKYSLAIDIYSHALQIQPHDPGLHYNLGLTYMDVNRTEEADACFRQALALGPRNEAIYSCFLFNLHYLEKPTPEEIFLAHTEWGSYAYPAPLTSWPGTRQYRTGDERLRIGYISPDLRVHSVSYFISPILQRHDRKKFSVYCYSDAAHPDDVTASLSSMVDVWRNVHGLANDTLVKQIQEDGIDILVDLSGHTSQNRLLVFSRKPAPVQITYLGYPDTTGLPEMDYRLSDYWADPPGAADNFCSEELIRLPNGFLCYAPPPASPPTGELPAQSAGYPTFVSFNNFAKVTPGVVSLWAQILREVTDARLLLKAKGMNDKAARDGLLGRFTQGGIAPERIEFIGYCRNLMEHLGMYNRADIALDSFPYNGATTTCEALWMGVPVITLAGDRHSARVGASILACAKLETLIANSPDEYVKLAVDLAKDTARLSALRQGLRERLLASPLTDAEGFVAGLEAAYLEVWRRNLEKLSRSPSP